MVNYSETGGGLFFNRTPTTIADFNSEIAKQKQKISEETAKLEMLESGLKALQSNQAAPKKKWFSLFGGKSLKKRSNKRTSKRAKK
jgi:hypothetical protein